MDSTERRLLVETNSNAAFAEPGYLLYLRDRTLVAQPFDVGNNTLHGEPRTLTDNVLYFPQVYRGVFSAGSGDVLVSQTGRGRTAISADMVRPKRKAARARWVGPPGTTM